MNVGGCEVIIELFGDGGDMEALTDLKFSLKVNEFTYSN